MGFWDYYNKSKDYFGIGRPGMGQFGSAVQNIKQNPKTVAKQFGVGLAQFGSEMSGGINRLSQNKYAKPIINNIGAVAPNLSGIKPVTQISRVAQPRLNKIVANNPATNTAGRFGRFLGENAAYLAIPEAKIPGVLKAATPIKRLVGSSVVRGLEGSAVNAAQKFGRGDSVSDIAKQIPQDVITGGLINTALSPRLAIKGFKFQNTASKMDAPIPTKYSQIKQGEVTGNLFRPNVKTETIPISQFEQELTGQKIPVKFMGEKGTVTKVSDPQTGKLISWSTDNPNFAKRVQEGKLAFGMSTREVKPSEATTSQLNRQPIPQATEKIGLSQSNQITTPTTQVNVSFDVNKYVNKQKASQKASEGKIAVKGKLGTVLQEIKTKLVDSNAPIEDVLSKAEKDGKFNVRPTNDIRYQIDRVLRSDSLATQSLKDSGIDRVIREVDDVDAFNQYLIAKQSKDVSSKGIKTGRNLAEDDAFINAVAEKYEPFAQQVYAHNRKMLDTLTDSGMISKELSDQLKKEYPNYVPLNRIFSEAEQSTMSGFGKSGAVASVGTQKVVKRLKGSERDIENPLESILTKTSQVFEQTEKNKAAKMLALYKDLPDNPFNLEEVIGTKSPGESTISFFDNGIKRVFKTDPEIAKAAKNMSQQQIGLLGQMFAVPTRLLKLGATGLNLPFVASNLVKDQVFASINSNRALSTSLVNPVNFGKALFETFKQGKLYDDWVRSGSSFNSWDMQRNALKPTVESIRAGRGLGSRVAYTVKHPQSFIKTLEDAIGKSEEITRIQQFNGIRDQLMKEGRTLEDATILAANASRNNTTNFARRGEWGTVINSAIPYINAGIQGSRTLMTSLKTRPIQTTFKIAGLVFTPMAMTTAWNLKDEKRKEAYNDIPEYEKEGNIIIIPDNPVKDENGRWNAIKIPMPPGVSNLASIVRRQMEGVDNFDTSSFARVAGDLLTTGTSVNPIQTDKLISQLTPQALKPGIESFTNKNLFTGLPIVPEYMKDLPEEEQVKKNTSGTARIIGGVTGSSPLKVENTIRTMGGGVGQQLLNASDQTLAKSGVIPQEQIGGKSVTDSFSSRFTSAAGGDNDSKVWDNINKQEQAREKENKSKREKYLQGDTSVLDGMTKQQRSSFINAAEEYQAKQSMTSLEKKIFEMSNDSKAQLLQTNPELAPTIERVLSIQNSLKSPSTGKIGKISLKKPRKGRKGKSLKAPRVAKMKIKSTSLPKSKKISLKKPKKIKIKTA